MLQEKNRKYYSNIKYHKKIYLVYYKKNSAGGYDKLVSDGPFKKLEEAVNKSIKEADLPEHIRIGAVVRKDAVIIPRSSFVFDKDDLVVLLAKREHLQEVENIFAVSSI